VIASIASIVQPALDENLNPSLLASPTPSVVHRLVQVDFELNLEST